MIRAGLIAAHAGTLIGPAILLAFLAPPGVRPDFFYLLAQGGPAVIVIAVLAVAQAVAGSILGLRNLRQITPVGVHAIGPTLIAWVGLGAGILQIAAASEVVEHGAIDRWTLLLAQADFSRQLGVMVAGWGWLAALASISLGAFARRGGAPRKPGIRLALIAAACTLPTVVLLLGGDMVAVPSALGLIAVALAAGGWMALAAPTISVWARSDDPPSRSQAFSTIWLCGCAAVVAVATIGHSLAWLAQSAALVGAGGALGPELDTALRSIVATAARAQGELSTELTYLSAGVAVAWLALAMRGRRVVLSAPSQNIGSVLVTFVLAMSIGIANNLYEHGATRRHQAVLEHGAPAIPNELDLPTTILPERSSLPVVRIDAETIAMGDNVFATRADNEWQWRGTGAIVGGPPADTRERNLFCAQAESAVAVAASASLTTSQVASALAGLRQRGVCMVQLLAGGLNREVPDMVSPWVRGVLERYRRIPTAKTFYLSETVPDGAVVVIVDEEDPPEPFAADMIALEWRGDLTLARALELAPFGSVLLVGPQDPQGAITDP